MVTEKDKEQMLDKIKKYLPHTKVYLFGSRARGDCLPESDIDIALDNGKKIDTRILSEIREEIEESLIPYTVDIVDLHAVSSDFKESVKKEGVLW